MKARIKMTQIEYSDLYGESITKTVVKNSTKNRTEETEEQSDTPIWIQISTGKIEQEKLQVSKQKKDEIGEEEPKALYFINKLASAEGSKGETGR